MKKTIILLLLLYAATTVMAQNNNDSISFTHITTTDFMEAIGGGTIQWQFSNSSLCYNKSICKNLFQWNNIVSIIPDAALVAPDEQPPSWYIYSNGKWQNAFGLPEYSTPILPTLIASGGIGSGGSGGGGSATTNNTNPLGNTTIPPPVKPVVDDETTKEELPIEKKDTLQPVKVPCNDSAIARGKYADSLWKELDSTGTAKKRLQDSAKSGKFESAFLIKKNANNKLEATNFTTSNSSTNVTPPPTTDTLYGGAHCHNNREGVNSQSPSDFFRLLTMFMQQKTYKTDFLTSYDETEWAIMIGDSLSAMSFINNSNYAYTTLVDTVGENINNWSTKNKNPVTGKYYYDDFYNYGNDLYDQNYPKDLLTAYANIYMVNKLFNTGIKVLMKVGNNFKELNVFEDNSSGESVLKIKICE